MLEDASVSGDQWEHFSRTAADFGIHSTLSMHLPVDSGELAASLNLYSKQHLDLAEQHISAAGPYAEQLAAAITSVDAHRSTATLARNLAEAMRSRAVIEQAKGILMSDHRIDEDQAFQRLVDLSTHANTKLRDVARRLVQERSQPRQG